MSVHSPLTKAGNMIKPMSMGKNTAYKHLGEDQEEMSNAIQYIGIPFLDHHIQDLFLHQSHKFINNPSYTFYQVFLPQVPITCFH